MPISVTLKVSANGRKVTDFELNVGNLPNTCGYGGPDGVFLKRKARIRHGRFTARLVQRTLEGGAVSATAKVTGRFRRHGRETGAITTTERGSSQCDGTFRYSARAGDASARGRRQRSPPDAPGRAAARTSPGAASR